MQWWVRWLEQLSASWRGGGVWRRHGFSPQDAIPPCVIQSSVVVTAALSLHFPKWSSQLWQEGPAHACRSASSWLVTLLPQKEDTSVLRLVVGPVWGQVLAEPPVIFDNYHTYYDTHTHHSRKMFLKNSQGEGLFHL